MIPYFPSRHPEVLFILCGPSGVGKGTIFSAILEWSPVFSRCRNWTNRPLRSGEIEGVEYFSISDNDLKKLKKTEELIDGEIPQYGYLYGIKLDEVKQTWAQKKLPIVEGNYYRIRQFKSKLKNVVTIFIAPPSIQALEERIRKRNRDNEQEIQIRLLESKKALETIPAELINYFVINDNLHNCIEIIKSIVVAELYRYPVNS